MALHLGDAGAQAIEDSCTWREIHGETADWKRAELAFCLCSDHRP